jgi:hypothetical protein
MIANPYQAAAKGDDFWWLNNRANEQNKFPN